MGTRRLLLLTAALAATAVSSATLAAQLAPARPSAAATPHTATPRTDAATPSAVDPSAMADDELYADAERLLGDELRLLAEAGPEGAGTSGRDAARRQLLVVDADGAQLLHELGRRGIELSPAVRDTLGALPAPGAGGPPTPPSAARYADAIADLRALAVADLADVVQVTDTVEVTDVVDIAGADSGSGPWWRSPATVAGAGVGAMALAVLAVAAARVRRRHRRLLTMASLDGLTGLRNRRALDDDLAAARRGSTGATVAVLMIDVDHFKHCNDTYGHAAGDDVLRQVAAMIIGRVRAGDRAFRYGGEELCVLLPDTALADAVVVADNLRRSVATSPMPVPQPVTVSIGVAAGPSASVDDLFAAADRALYDAKRGGRDRVVAAWPSYPALDQASPVAALRSPSRRHEEALASAASGSPLDAWG